MKLTLIESDYGNAYAFGVTDDTKPLRPFVTTLLPKADTPALLAARLRALADMVEEHMIHGRAMQLGQPPGDVVTVGISHGGKLGTVDAHSGTS